MGHMYETETEINLNFTWKLIWCLNNLQLVSVGRIDGLCRIGVKPLTEKIDEL